MAATKDKKNQSAQDVLTPEQAALAAEKAALEAERQAITEEKARLMAEKAALETAKEAAAQAAAKAATPAPVPAASGKTVVYCKLPSGLSFPLPDGNGKIVLAGAASKESVAGYGVTRVDAAQWAGIEAAYGDLPVFKNGTVFAQTSTAKGDAQAREQAGVTSGFEGVDPKKPTQNTEALKKD